MTDLVERLREGVRDTGTMINTAATVNRTMADAADEIERLQAENARLTEALEVADEGRSYANEMLQIAAVDTTKLHKSIDKITKRSRERAEELDLLRTQVRELRHSRDRLMDCEEFNK